MNIDTLEAAQAIRLRIANKEPVTDAEIAAAIEFLVGGRNSAATKKEPAKSRKLGLDEIASLFSVPTEPKP